MSNFQFLQEEWPSLYKKSQLAEQRARTEPLSTGYYARLALEEAVHHIYDIEGFDWPYNDSLVNLLKEPDFKAVVPSTYDNGLYIIRKTGNNAAHYNTRRVGSQEAIISLTYLFDFLKWFSQSYSQNPPPLPQQLDQSFIPKLGAEKRQLKAIKKELEANQKALEQQIQQLQAERAAAEEKAQQSKQALEQYQAQQKAEKEALQQQKLARQIPLPSSFTEAQTRQHLIDVNLQAAGWGPFQKGYHTEYPVTGMPLTKDNPKGKGYVDYVLWDDNGKPLALIEAKRAKSSIETGRHQAALYANCLEQMHGQRPIIFYTNGYEIMLWEDTFYSAPRKVAGFYDKDALQWLIQQRTTRKDLRKGTVDLEIAGRPYQIEAIQRVAESLVTGKEEQWRGNKRRALLVMATGSGKTRTAAALVKLLFQHNWVKRVLFLADRTALVDQALKDFKKYLDQVTSVDLTQDKEKEGTRLVFSTYPTMMNQIDNAQTATGRFYGVGHFDLILVDEAHRSVYDKYKAIFDYFDALLIGLTATPKGSIDFNTYELFDCAKKDPTFNYSLEEAIPLYLNPYKTIPVSTKFMREGILYKDLPEADKREYEATFTDYKTGTFPEEIKANAMNKWLFNKDTAYKVLDALMEQGLKIEGGDKIGRTIIFAVNQDHAQFIVECFQERYPEYPPEFIAMIHNKVSHAKSLIKGFCDEYTENNPQIAVSVDMMDTGINAPRLLNLVFFKVVRSYAKFWQMIGRGTRLCPDAFGPNQPKEYFLIFDVCQNFEFFDVNPKGTEASVQKSLTQQTFEAKLTLSQLLQDTGKPENFPLVNQLLDELHQSIATLDKRRFQVEMQLRYVHEFEHRERWNSLSNQDVHHLQEHLASLPTPAPISEQARRFDLMVLRLHLAAFQAPAKEEKYHNNLLNIAQQLSKKYTISQVLQSQALIEQMKQPAFYKTLTHPSLNELREEIRELVQFLESSKIQPLYTNLEDVVAISSTREPLPSYGQPTLYKNRVEQFIRENKTHLTIYKLTHNQPINQAELEALEQLLFDGGERGTKEEFLQKYGEQPLGKFVRSIVGLEKEALQEAFAAFLQTGTLTANQMTFLQNIITYLSKNGHLEQGILFEAPFTNLHEGGLLGIFEYEEAENILSILRAIEENSGVA